MILSKYLVLGKGITGYMDNNYSNEHIRISHLKDDRILYDLCFSQEKLKNVFKEIGNRIASERNRQKKSVAELAELCNFNVSNIYRIEAGVKDYQLSTFLKVVWVLNVPLDSVVPFNQYTHQESVGEKFEKLVRDLDVNSVNQILHMVEIAVNCMSSDS